MSLKPGGKSRTTWAPWKNGRTHLLASAGGSLSPGAWAAATAYGVLTALARMASHRPLQGEGSFHRPSDESVLQQKEPMPFLPWRQGCWIHSSSLSCSLSAVNGAQGSPKRRAEYQPDATPTLTQVVFPAWGSLGGGSRGHPLPGQPILVQLAESPRTSTWYVLLPSHVILFLDWTQKLFGGWTAAR